MEIFIFYEMRRNQRNRKRVISARGGSGTLAFS
jgi:hypothetical protein